jgi:hypothetical protein
MMGRTPWSCRRARGRLTQRFYELLSPARRRALDRHLQKCRACRAEWEATQRALGRVDSDTAFPYESQVDWQRFARDTVAKARQAEGARDAGALPGWRGPRLSPLLAWGGPLAALLVAITIVLPRLDRTEAPPEADAPAVSAESTLNLQRSVARQGAARYLRDSRSLLVGLIEAPVRCRRADGAYDLTLERERSRQLLRKKNLYLGSLGGPGDQRLADLVGQLEALLLQVSSFDDCTTARQIHDLRDAIDRRQILMRIDLVTRSMEGGAPRV